MSFNREEEIKEYVINNYKEDGWHPQWEALQKITKVLEKYSDSDLETFFKVIKIRSDIVSIFYDGSRAVMD